MLPEKDTSEEGTKICSKRGRRLPLSEFANDKHRKDAKYAQCKDCVHQSYEANRPARLAAAKRRAAEKAEDIKQYQAEYYEKKKEELKAASAANYADNRESRLIKMRKYAELHRGDGKKRLRAWRDANREYSNQYKRERLELDPEKRRRENESKRDWALRNP